MDDAAPIAPANPWGYSAPVWQRFSAPAHAGRFTPGTAGVARGEAGTPASRALLRLEFRFQANRVAEARFQAYGCPTSIAVGEWLAAWALGKTPVELRGLKAAELRAALEIADDRAHCAAMGEDAVLALLTQLPEPPS